MRWRYLCSCGQIFRQMRHLFYRTMLRVFPLSKNRKLSTSFLILSFLIRKPTIVIHISHLYTSDYHCYNPSVGFFLPEEDNSYHYADSHLFEKKLSWKNTNFIHFNFLCIPHVRNYLLHSRAWKVNLYACLLRYNVFFLITDCAHGAIHSYSDVAFISYHVTRYTRWHKTRVLREIRRTLVNDASLTKYFN
jgi:hypothetical protein